MEWQDKYRGEIKAEMEKARGTSSVAVARFSTKKAQQFWAQLDEPRGPEPDLSLMEWQDKYRG